MTTISLTKTELFLISNIISKSKLDSAYHRYIIQLLMKFKKSLKKTSEKKFIDVDIDKFTRVNSILSNPTKKKHAKKKKTVNING